jgi:hypothetical protein
MLRKACFFARQARTVSWILQAIMLFEEGRKTRLGLYHKEKWQSCLRSDQRVLQ